MKKYTVLPNELLVKNLPKVEDLSVEEQYNPNTVAVVYVKGDCTIGKYKYQWKHRNKAANLLGVGGALVMVLPHSDAPATIIKVKDLELIEEWVTTQTIYVALKYKTLTPGFYKDMAHILFKGMTKTQLRVFNTHCWEPYMAGRYNTEVLDLEFAEALKAYEPERKELAKAYAEKQRVNALWNEAVKWRHNNKSLQVFRSKEEMLKLLPNQEVTAPGKGEAAELEKVLVSAWYYLTPGFRLPTLDDQIEELENLRAWFEQYKYHARRNNVRTPQAKTVEKFSRLEWLEIEVGPYLQGDQGLATLGNPPKTSDHESRAFKLNRLSQLLRRRNELCEPLLIELKELEEELNK